MHHIIIKRTQEFPRANGQKNMVAEIALTISATEASNFGTRGNSPIFSTKMENFV